MEKARADGRLWEIDTGHDLMITEPDGGHRGVAADRGRVMSSHPAPPAGIDPLDLVDPERFAHRGYPHEVWTHLRAEAPVTYFEPPGYQPFWAITKHADITDDHRAAGALLERARPHPRARSARPRSRRRWSSRSIRRATARLRRVAMRRLTPRAIRSRQDEIDRIAVEVLDEAAVTDGTRGIRLRRAHRRAAPASR